MQSSDRFRIFLVFTISEMEPDGKPGYKIEIQGGNVMNTKPGITRKQTKYLVFQNNGLTFFAPCLKLWQKKHALSRVVFPVHFAILYIKLISSGVRTMIFQALSPGSNLCFIIYFYVSLKNGQVSKTSTAVWITILEIIFSSTNINFIIRRIFLPKNFSAPNFPNHIKMLLSSNFCAKKTFRQKNIEFSSGASSFLRHLM